MQALCQWEVQGDASGETLTDFFTTQEASPKARGFATTLFEGYQARRDEIDRRIEQAVDRWDLSRISPVERNTMRVAVAELTAGDVPPKVVLNEAIELGRAFGGKDSPRFINGILDRILHVMTESKEEQG